MAREDINMGKEESEVEAQSEEISNFGDLRNAYSKAKAQAKENMAKDLENFAKIAKTLPVLSAQLIKRGLEAQKNKIDRNFQEIDSEKILSQSKLFNASLNRTVANESWSIDRDGRSDKALDFVDNVKQNSLDRRKKVVGTAVKVTSVVGKGLALFGKKDLAKNMMKKVTEIGEKHISKESRVGRLMEKVFDGGFYVADTARTVKSAVEKVPGKVVSGAKAVQDFGKAVGEDIKTNVHNGALAVGKATYRGAANVVGLAELGVGAVVERGKQVGDKVQEGAQYVENQADIAVNYGKLAKDKVLLAKSKMSLGIKGFIAKGAKSVLEKITPSLDKTKTEIGEKESAIQNREEAINDKRSALSPKPKEDMGMEI